MSDDVLDKLDGYDDSEELDEPIGLVEVPRDEDLEDSSEGSVEGIETGAGHPLDGLTSEQKDAVLQAFSQATYAPGPSMEEMIEGQLAGLADLQYTNPVEAERHRLALAVQILAQQFAPALNHSAVANTTTRVLREVQVPEEVRPFVNEVAEELGYVGELSPVQTRTIAEIAAGRAALSGKLKRGSRVVSSTSGEGYYPSLEPSVPEAVRRSAGAFEKAFGVKVDAKFLKRHEVDR